MTKPLNHRKQAPRRSRQNGIRRRREKRTRWVQRGEYAVEVQVEVVYPVDDPSEPCLEPATVRWLDEIARRAEQGNLAFLRCAGKVYRLVRSAKALSG
jgi:hypothetical protein